MGILGSDSEDTSACDSYGSQSEEFMEHETESYRTLNTRLHQEKKGKTIAKNTKIYTKYSCL